MVIDLIVLVLALALVLFAFLPYFERSQIYYPFKAIEQTPGDVGLAYEDIYFKTEDSVTLNGWYIPQTDAIATIIYCHGNGGNIAGRLETLQHLHNLKVNVFIFDYRGYGKSAGCPSEEGTYRDGMAAYRYLESRRDVDMKNIILFGESLGGAIATEMAMKIKPAGLILDSSFCSIQEISKDFYPIFPIRPLIRTKYDTLSKIKQIHCPALVANSKEDDIVPFHHGQELFAAANEPKEFLLLHGTHNDCIGMNDNEALNILEHFIQRAIQHRN